MRAIVAKPAAAGVHAGALALRHAAKRAAVGRRRGDGPRHVLAVKPVRFPARFRAIPLIGAPRLERRPAITISTHGFRPGRPPLLLMRFLLMVRAAEFFIPSAGKLPAARCISTGSRGDGARIHFPGVTTPMGPLLGVLNVGLPCDFSGSAQNNLPIGQRRAAAAFNHTHSVRFAAPWQNSLPFHSVLSQSA